MTVLEMQGVRKEYGGVPALDGLDLTVQQGEIVAVLGPNGAGKTTTFELLLGLIRPSAGTVRVLGEAGTTAAPIAPAFPQRYADSYRKQIAHFADVAHGRAQSRTHYGDGIAALVLAEACQASARSGRRVALGNTNNTEQT